MDNSWFLAVNLGSLSALFFFWIIIENILIFEFSFTSKNLIGGSRLKMSWHGFGLTRITSISTFHRRGFKIVIKVTIISRSSRISPRLHWFLGANCQSKTLFVRRLGLEQQAIIFLSMIFKWTCIHWSVVNDCFNDKNLWLQELISQPGKKSQRFVLAGDSVGDNIIIHLLTQLSKTLWD